MLKQEEIKKLIESGFDLELISFELDIPLEQVKQCKLDMETSNNTKTKTSYTAKDIIDERNKHAHSKISKMRGKYKKIYFRSDKLEIVIPEALSQQEMESIRKVIATIQETIEKMKTLPKKEKRENATTIVKELKKIDEYQLPIAEAEQLYALISSEELSRLKLIGTDKIDETIGKQKDKLAKKFAKAIQYEQYNINNIEELQKLDRKITWDMVNVDPIGIGSIKTRILNRITAMRQQKTIDNIRNNIPTSIMSILSDLANGNIDIEKANAIIDAEAKKRVKSRPKTRFSLTEEQERRQILIQIRRVIAERTDKFNIQDPEKTISQLQKLCGGELGQSIGAVVENLTNKKEFEIAKSICDKYLIENDDEQKESEQTKRIRELKNKIRNEEISNIVLKAINMNGTIEEERKYIELIEESLKMENINLTTISLGKSEDGVRKITLADIWTDEIEKGKSR